MTPARFTEFRKYSDHKERTRHRVDILGNQIQFKLTFEEWKAIWDASGQSENRGTRKGQYCMARFGDIGNYEVGNVKIQLSSENFKEACKRGHPAPNKGQKSSPETIAKQSAVMKEIRATKKWSTAAGPNDGRRRPLSEEHKAKMRATFKAKVSTA